ncbi:hypothetical protein [Thaumasiovibrio subtropicus]|uniref:hypothetical protein n=1 Tax=Thaumasiovibrio subtropicus TaxID=1891207 RepID=UPI000B35AD50|nr:hypothetical protein [Thaumasiovibrio subtropicus]
MWNKYRSTFYLTVLLGFHLSEAMACARFDEIKTSHSHYEYAVFENSAQPLDIPIEVDITQTIDCDTHVRFATLNHAKQFSKAQQHLVFDWYSDDGEPLGNGWVKPANPKTSTTMTIRFPVGQFVIHGNYQQTLSAQLINQDNGRILDERQFDLAVTVAPSAQFHFYGTTQRHIPVNLGELKSHHLFNTLPILLVKSTSEYKITAYSDHQGQLRHLSGRQQWDIPYQLRLGDTPLDLSQDHAEWHSLHPTHSYGEQLPLQLSIGDVSRQPAGIYHDVIHLSIEPALALAP